MNELYYTPSLEEFHVGFEYEFYDIKFEYPIKMLNAVQAIALSEPKETGQWIKEVVNPTSFQVATIIEDDITVESMLEYYLKEKMIRVKSLVMDDITDCVPGLEYDKKRNAYFMEQPDMILWICPENDEQMMIGYEKKEHHPLALKPNLPFFYGKIRNKSELKVILKQLGI